MKRTKTVRSMAAGLAAAMAFAGLGIGAALSANAVDVAKKPQISATEKGKLHIYKRTPGSKTVNADGTKIADPTTALGAESKPVEGIKFKIQRVLKADKTAPIDLTTNEGWKEATEVVQDAAGNVATDRLQDVNGKPAAATNAEGVVSFEDLDLGLYYVTEEIPTTGVKIDGQETDSKKLTPVKPFLVTLPMTNPARDEWMYEVYVYPKNQPTDLTKTVVDDTTKPVVSADSKPVNTYEIKLGIPAPTTANGKYDQFMMVDVFNTGEMVWQENDNEVFLLKDDGSKLDAPTFAKPADYDFVKTEAAATNKTYVTLVFTKEGRKKIADARKVEGAEKAVKVAWKLKAEIQPFAAGTTYKTIQNETFAIPVDPNNTNFGGANWDPSNPKPPGDDEIEKPKAKSKFGSVKIKKHAAGNEATKLQDAEFKLYICAADGAVADDATPLAVGEIKTNAEGEVTVTGLRLNDFKDGKTIASPTEYYCLVETKAPANYSLLAKPFKFQLLQEHFPGATDADNTTPHEIKIPNVPSNGGFELPITGGRGILLIVLSGGLLVAGSLFYTISIARKNRKES